MNDIFKLANKSITADNILPVLAFYENPKNYKINIELPKYNDYITLVNSYNVKPEHFYLTQNPLSPVVYYDGVYTLIELYGLTPDMLKFVQFDRQLGKMDKLVSERKFELIFALLDNRYASFVFFNTLSYYTNSEFLDIFKLVYSQQEYDFDIYNAELLSKLKALKHHIPELEPHTSEDGYITIYRGESSQSTHYTDALSWTLSPRHARFFANRFDYIGIVYKAKVKAENVLVYIDREEDVLVESGYLEEVEEYKE